MPENGKLKPNSSGSSSSFELVAGESMISHSDVLKKPNPWHWMRANLNLVVELNVHGNRQYETVVLARVAKFEALCLRLEA